MRILQVYNSAPHYRESVFHAIDEHFDCVYVFGKQKGDIKQMDYSKLKGRSIITNNKSLGHGFYWQPGVQSFLNKEYDAFLLLGDSRCLSTWMFCLRAWIKGRRHQIYFWTHGWYGKENHIERWLKKRFYSLAGGGIFLYGYYARDLMINHEGFDANKLFVIHNSLAYERQIEIRQKLRPLDIYYQHFGNENPNLIFVGRLTKVKKLDLALRAMAQLKEQGHYFNLTLIGDGIARTDLEQLTNEMGLQSNVWFYGACYDEQQLGQFVYNADLCVSPGNVGLTAMHVMVFGTPVLTHDDFSHQMPEFEAIHDGVTGTFFHRNDVASLKESIIRWFDAKKFKREEVRRACYFEIDTQWNPKFQINVLIKHLK